MRIGNMEHLRLIVHDHKINGVGHHVSFVAICLVFIIIVLICFPKPQSPSINNPEKIFDKFVVSGFAYYKKQNIIFPARRFYRPAGLGNSILDVVVYGYNGSTRNDKGQKYICHSPESIYPTDLEKDYCFLVRLNATSVGNIPENLIKYNSAPEYSERLSIFVHRNYTLLLCIYLFILVVDLLVHFLLIKNSMSPYYIISIWCVIFIFLWSGNTYGSWVEAWVNHYRGYSYLIKEWHINRPFYHPFSPELLKYEFLIIRDTHPLFC